MKSIVALTMVMAVSAAFAEKRPLSDYQSIIDRQMFGPLPPGFDPTKSPSEVQKSSPKDEKQLTQEQQKLQSAVHFSVINVMSDGVTQVGFTDNSNPKAPAHYYLKVGESRDGWTVKEADAEKATMTIVKGEIEVSLSLGGNSAKDETATKAATAAPTGPAAGGARRIEPRGNSTSIRTRRQADRKAQEEESRRRQEESQARHEQAMTDIRNEISEIIEQEKRRRDLEAKESAARAAETAERKEGESDAENNPE